MLTKIVGGVAIACAGAAAVAGYGAFSRSAQIFGRSAYRGSGRRRSVALTFDDGPSPATPELLDFLAAEGIRATFFQCGMNASRHPEIARRVHDEGHQVGNHTFSHARLCPRFGRKLNLRSPENIYRELAETQEILTAVSGVRPTLFRAPYGMRWWGLGAAQRRLGLLGVMWTVIGHDWEWSADKITAHVLHGLTPGGILCQSVNASEMLAALKRIVPEIKARGYRFETVGELLSPDLSGAMA